MTNIASTVRFLPPNGKARTITANGRFYSCAANGTIDVPPCDAIILAANGWVQVAGSGTTAQRPANPFFGQLLPRHHPRRSDVVFDGAVVAQSRTGASV